MIDFKQVGKKITTLRRANNLSQENLADMLYVTRQCLSKWELGIAIPNVDILLELCRIFKVAIDDILCLSTVDDIDPNNIFQGHERMFIINKIIHNELDVSIPDVFYQLAPSERLLVLKNVISGNTHVDMDELQNKLTNSERNYIGGRFYEIQESNN